jgi:GDP-L-fucose synthase
LLTPSRRQLDLRSQRDVNEYFSNSRPEYVLHCAGTVGGIQANNKYRADFIRDNLLMSANLIDSSHQYGIRKILVLGSSCIYPRLASQPLREEYIMTGSLEPTNEPYAMAKLAGLSMASAYHAQHALKIVLAVGANTYGPGDNFGLESSHVIPALLRKFHEAKAARAPEVVMWGSGNPIREFIYVDDLASALIFLMGSRDDPAPINVGTGEEVSIATLAATVAEIVGYPGRIVQDRTKPDGMPKKVLEISKIRALGWRACFDLRAGLTETYKWFKENSLASTVRLAN